MEWIGEVWQRLAFLFRRGQFHRDLEEEMADHVRMKARDLNNEGSPPEEAQCEAKREFGNALLLREKSRDAWGFRWLETLLQDVRYGLRQLRRNPGFTGVAVITLALGIGANTAMFSVIECGVLDPLPYVHSHRMAVVVARYKDAGPDYYTGWFPVQEFFDFRANNHVFEQVIGYRHEDCVFRGREEALDFNCLQATGNFFQFIGMHPLLGRMFMPADAAPGAPPVAVLRYTTWRSKFGGDPKIVGRTLALNGQPRAVIGVMPPRFGWGDADFWVPHDFAAETAAEPQRMMSMQGLLKPGVSVGQAAAEIRVLAKHFIVLHPERAPTGFYKGESLSVESLLSVVRPEVDKILYLLFSAVGLLLAIACANVANLLLARATTRESEVAVRASLGAGRARLAGQFMVESLLLAAGGALVGCLLAWPGLKALMDIIPAGDIPNEAVIRLNGTVLLFAALVALAATVFFGLAPALRAARKDLQASLNSGGRGGAGSRGQAVLRNVLVIGEIALSLILLTGAGLLMRSFLTVRYESPGFDSSHVLETSLELPESRYKTAEQRNIFETEMLGRLRNVPGVVSAALAVPPPPYYADASAISVMESPNRGKWRAQIDVASDGYFRTMHIPLLRGRDISEEDCHLARKVAVVNRAFARRYLAGEDPLGREVTVEALSKPPTLLKSPTFEVIGVAADIRNNGPGQPTQPAMHIPYTVVGGPYSFYVARTAVVPSLLVNPIRRMVAQMDNELPVEAESLHTLLSQYWYTEPRFVMTVMSVFAALGLALVLIGVYSVLSYSVARRTHEIGIRVALGAQKADVQGMVIRQGTKLAVIGVAVGIAGASGLTRFLSSLLYGVKPTDPMTFVGVSLLLAGVALLACWIPARRATKVDPMIALRCE
jgi:putative ABC transport system permease protein